MPTRNFEDYARYPGTRIWDFVDPIRPGTLWLSPTRANRSRHLLFVSKKGYLEFNWQDPHNYFHRGGDLPAKIRVSPSSLRLEWFCHGLPYRSKGRPALEVWENRVLIVAQWLDAWGVPHRTGDRPAIEEPHSLRWYQEGQCQRDGDKPTVINKSGEKHWYRENMFHRDGGLPAIIQPDGTKGFLIKGVHHRVVGPAIQSPDGTKDRFLLEGEEYTREQWSLHPLVQGAHSPEDLLRYL